MGASRLGVLGGTFNPIHLGHLHIAQSAQRLFKLDRIYFVVASAPPHKSLRDLVPLMHRYAMVCLATAGSRYFVPSLIELDPPASAFSIHTMEKLARRNPGKDKRLYFIAGGDSLAEVSTWKESERLLLSYNFIFVTRPGASLGEPGSFLPAKVIPAVTNLVGMRGRQLRDRILAEEESRGNRVFVVDLDALDISASQIRARVSRGKRVRHLLPPTVSEYLRKTHLYGE